MAEHEADNFESCAICGRTILRGERVSEYVAPDGSRERICALCKTRAEAAGWVPAELAGTLARGPSHRRRRTLALRERLTRAAERMRPPQPPLPERPRPSAQGEPVEALGSGGAAPPRRAQNGGEERQARREPHGAQRRPQGQRARGRAAAAKPRAQRAETEAPDADAPPRRRRAPDTPQRRVGRAVEQFNASEQSRTVAGLMRSLGLPRAAVRSIAGKPARAHVTVAWELSWYRWEVELEGEERVREIGKGSEVEELAEDERRWNASVSEDGTLRLRAARRAPAGETG